MRKWAYRTDKFAVGDKVSWAKKHRDTAKSIVEKWSDGPFTIKTIIDRDYEPPYNDLGQSNWSSMGHTQHVTVEELPYHGTFSGAFFILAKQKEILP